MIHNEVAKKYSQALFELAKEADDLSSFQKELTVIQTIVNENEDFHKIFYHQRILAYDKKQILTEIFAGQAHDLVLNFIYLLVDKRREYSLDSIIQEFNRLVNKEEQIVEVEVVSAIELAQKQKENLENKLKEMLGYQIVIKDRCDPAIIGGLILKIGDYIIDGSIKNHLTSLEEKIEQIPVSELGV